MYNANLYKRVVFRGRGIMNATRMNLRKERHKPNSVLRSIRIETAVDTSNTQMPRGGNGKHASGKAADGSSLEFRGNSKTRSATYHGKKIKEMKEWPKPVSVTQHSKNRGRHRDIKYSNAVRR